MNVDELVTLLALAPHPEGGFYRETFRASERVQRAADGQDGRTEAHHRTAGTAIYFLLPEGSFSAWHRVGSDETWHHYDGAPLELHTIDGDGVHGVALLGRDFARGERPQHVVPKGVFQAARPLSPQADSASYAALAARSTAHPYALCGCTVSPGFEFEDFEMPSRAEMHLAYPHLSRVIELLTRG